MRALLPVLLTLFAVAPVWGQVTQQHLDGRNDIFNRSTFDKWVQGDPNNPIDFDLESLDAIDMHEVNAEFGGATGAVINVNTESGRNPSDNFFIGFSARETGGQTVSTTNDRFDSNTTHFYNGFINGDILLGKQAGVVNEAADGFEIFDNPPGFEIELINETTIRLLIDEGLLPDNDFTWGLTTALVALVDGEQVAVFDEVGGDGDDPVWTLNGAADCDLDIALAIENPQEEYQLNQLVTVLATVTNEGVDADNVVLTMRDEEGLNIEGIPDGCREVSGIGQPVACEIGTMAGGTSQTIAFTYRIRGSFDSFRPGDGIEPEFTVQGLVSKGIPRLGAGRTLGRYETPETRLTIIDSQRINEENRDPFDFLLNGTPLADDVQLDRPVTLDNVAVTSTEGNFGISRQDGTLAAEFTLDWFTDNSLSLAAGYTALLGTDAEGNATVAQLDGTPAPPSDPDAVNITAFFTGSNEQNLNVSVTPLPDGEDAWMVNDRLLARMFRDVRAGDTVINIFDGDNVILQSNAFNTDQGRGQNYRVGIRFIPDKRLAFDVKVFDPDGALVETAVVTDTESDAGLPTAYALLENYPNPFNPSTKIGFALPEPAPVTLAVYDLTGRHVQTIAEGLRAAGTHTATWDGADAKGHPVASGVYLYRMTAGDFVQTRKMLLVK